MLHEATCDTVGLIRPPRRVTVADASAESLYISESGRWEPDTAPYMIRPMNETASRHHDVVAFVGPARTGKTLAMILGRYVYTVTCHPLDFAVIHSSQDLARDMSIRDLARLHRYSDVMHSAQTTRASDDNTYDKRYKSGILAVLGWPSSKQLASRTIPVMLLTDYGRWPGDIGGEGDGFTQARKRTQTAGSLAMTVIESSPGEDVSPEDDSEPQQYELGKPLSHAFPATVASPENSRICPIYNAGTREWWYVPCQACGEYYPQDWRIERFSWTDDPDPIKAAEGAGTACCWCGAVHPEATKRIENTSGEWLAEGQVIDCNGKITGESRLGKTYPSFSIGGGAAAYQTRKSIVVKYLTAMDDAKTTGDENSLRGTVRSDLGAPYRPLKSMDGRAVTPLMRRARPVNEHTVPDGVRFLLAGVDVQHDRFVVQIMGYGPDRNRWLPIDYYNLRRSERIGDDGQCLNTDPAAYQEDWELLTPLIDKAYPLTDGRYMAIAGVLCDSGGADGVTENALAYWRKLSPEHRRKFRLVKGDHRPSAPLLEERWPDTRTRKDRGASRGDVPILFINSNRLKTRLANDLSRDEHGAGYCHFPAWVGQWWYKGLTREKRDEKGQWSSASKNEPWDLMVYGEAGAILGIPFGRRPTGIDRPGFWDHPPPWAKEPDSNSHVIKRPGERKTPPQRQPRQPRTLSFRR